MKQSASNTRTYGTPAWQETCALHIAKTQKQELPHTATTPDTNFNAKLTY